MSYLGAFEILPLHLYHQKDITKNGHEYYHILQRKVTLGPLTFKADNDGKRKVDISAGTGDSVSDRGAVDDTTKHIH